MSRPLQLRLRNSIARVLYRRVCTFQRGGERVAHEFGEAGICRGIVYREDSGVEEAAQDVERNLSRLAQIFSELHVVGGGEVAEEVALTHSQFAEIGGSAVGHLLHDGIDRLLQLLAVRGIARLFHHAMQGFAQTGKLIQMLAQAEVSLQRRKECLLYKRQGGFALHGLPREGEAGPHQRFLAYHLAGHIVVAAAVGDAAANHFSRIVQDDRLGGRGAEINANVDPQGAHALTPARFCSSIWR